MSETTFYYGQSPEDNQWYWHLRVNGNGKIVADGGEGYTTKAACLNGIAIVKRCANAPVHEVKS